MTVTGFVQQLLRRLLHKLLRGVIRQIQRLISGLSRKENNELKLKMEKKIQENL